MGRRVLVAVVLATVLIAGVNMVVLVPGDGSSAVTIATEGTGVVVVRVVIDDVDANRGVMKVRLAAVPGSDPIPDGGISVLADVEGIAPLRVEPDPLTTAEDAGEIRFERGNVSAYPFDTYSGEFAMLAVAGTPNTFADVVASETVPMTVVMVDASSGFDVVAAVDTDVGGDVEVAGITYSVDRSPPSVVWASIMMGIYWLLTAAIVAVVLVVVLGHREWETRHLAWLAAMLFAFASFRAAAPGSPPIGVYFDYVSFFWAELIVALCLAALVTFYLASTNIPGATPAGDPPDEPRPLATGGPTDEPDVDLAPASE